MEIDIKAMLEQAKSHQAEQPFGVSFDTLPEKFPEKVPRENQKTSVAFLFAWAAVNDVLDVVAIEAEFPQFSYQGGIIRNRTPVQFLEMIDDRFMPRFVVGPARSFLLAYFWPGWRHRYNVDFDKVFVTEYADALLVKPGFPSTWHVPGAWPEFDSIAPLISQRFSEWQASR